MSHIPALTLSDSPLPVVKVHPTAILSILNCYSRRSDKNQRVIGTLLGSVKDNIVEVTDCYGFPHQESIIDGKISVTLDVQMSQAMFSFHRRVNKNEQIVGWYATSTSDGNLIPEYSSLINEFYNGQCKNPIHLVVDTSLSTDNMAPHCFVCRPMIVDGHVLGSVFDRVSAEMSYSTTEQICTHHMIYDQIIGAGHRTAGFEDTTIYSAIPSDKESVQNAIDRLSGVIQKVQSYVDQVISGKITPSNEIGMIIYEAMSKLSIVKQSDIATLVRQRNQDLAMLSYLASLVETQLEIAEKINSVL